MYTTLLHLLFSPILCVFSCHHPLLLLICLNLSVKEGMNLINKMEL